MSRVRLAASKDESTLKALLRDNPMDSWVSITLEREPSYFKGSSLMGESYTFISEDKDQAVGMFSCSYLPVHFNGEKMTMGYLGGLRVSQRFRHKIGYIKEGFDAIEKLLPPENRRPFYFTSIATENTNARKLLEANLKGMPIYIPRGQLTTLIFSAAAGKKGKLLQRASAGDIPQIAAFYNERASAFQFSPCLDESWLENLDGSLGLAIDDFWLMKDSDGRLKGCLALWDQRSFKQGVVRDYRAPLKQMRWLYNLYAHLSGQVKLPACGETLEHLYISFFAYENTGDALRLLQEAAYLSRRYKGVTSCILGLSSKHILLPVLKKSLKPSLYLTEIETVVPAGNERVEVNLDDRMVQPEVALL